MIPAYDTSYLNIKPGIQILTVRGRCNDAKRKIGLPYAFPPFSMISRVLLKIKQEYVPLLILIAPVWSTMGPRTLKPLCQGTGAAAPGTRNSDSTKNIVCSMTVENSLTLTAWLVSGKPFCVKEY